MKSIRVQIIGGPGNGKSTLARKLGRSLEIPVIHIDDILWQPGWTMLAEEKLKQEVIDIAESNQSWIFDGNYSVVRPHLVDRATHMIFIRIPFYRILWRLLVRETVRRFSRPVIPVTSAPKYVIHDNHPESLLNTYYEFFRGAYRHYAFRTQQIFQEVKNRRSEIPTFVLTDHNQFHEVVKFLKSH